jgi:hypothetical protein
MSAQKKWNLQSFPSGSTLFGTNSTYTITCAGDNTFVNLNQADLILTISAVGLGANSYGITRPSTAWISQINTTVQYITKDGPQIVNYNGYNNRGVAANALEILEYSGVKFEQYDALEYLTPVAGLTDVNFDVVIPLKFLADVAYDAQLLNIDYISFNISFEPQSRIFTTTSTTPVVFNTPRLDIKYPTITTTSSDLIPSHVREIPNRQVYVQNIDLLAGVSAANTQVSVPFPCSVLYYFFISNGGSTYNMNPNPSSAVTNHSLTSMGETFPLISNYNSVMTTPTSGVGMKRHFMELMDISGKDRPENNSTLTYPTWLNTNRIYTIEVGVEQHAGQNFNFAANFSTTTTVPSTCVMVFLGRRII